MSVRKAIVLRGSMGVGKSTVAKELVTQLKNCAVVVLDDGWAQHQARYVGGVARYADIRRAQHDVLVIELGCGEPTDLRSAGATKAADEWLQALSDTKREVFLFRLWADWPSVHSQILGRCPDQAMAARLWYAAYDANLDIVRLPPDIEKRETRIDVSRKSPTEVVAEIRKRAKC